MMVWLESLTPKDWSGDDFRAWHPDNPVGSVRLRVQDGQRGTMPVPEEVFKLLYASGWSARHGYVELVFKTPEEPNMEYVHQFNVRVRSPNQDPSTIQNVLERAFVNVQVAHVRMEIVKPTSWREVFDGTPMRKRGHLVNDVLKAADKAGYQFFYDGNSGGAISSISGAGSVGNIFSDLKG
ncbi:MAG: hypothetical protein WAK40_00020 [Thermoplasmata archaeon]